VPEGDTIFRTAHTLQRALAGVAIRRPSQRMRVLIGSADDPTARRLGEARLGAEEATGRA
jgi:hypothetical protein